jgi:hypothetical protein
MKIRNRYADVLDGVAYKRKQRCHPRVRNLGWVNCSPYAFMQLLDTLKTNGPENEELVEWLGEDYDPQQLPDCFSDSKPRPKKAAKQLQLTRTNSPLA